MPANPRPTPGQWPYARPIVKWTGGKTAELDAIRAAMPPGTPRRWIEPFVGGGAALLAMPPTVEAAANDRSRDLVGLYRRAAALDGDMIRAVEAVEAAWSAIAAPPGDGPAAVRRACRHLDALFGEGVAAAAERHAARATARKTARNAVLRARGEEEGDAAPLLLAALKGGMYTALRDAFNGIGEGPERTALFWFLRETCYGGMFRTNARGGCNVPYGGISYNARSMRGRLDQVRDPATAARLSATRFECGDFAPFLEGCAAGEGDFVFLDPPYDSPFSTYDGSAFTRDDHRRLAAWMAGTRASWMLVISETPFVRDCYCGLPGAAVTAFGKTYKGSIKERYSKKAVHLVVTNYGRGA